ncbi:hypothetical protein B0H16DRAFT_1886089 [Mycena metata]|uniref:Uncharacterized protein n=1 Tax=Mycena metata TaxID=1033252 RepID=A0AAD7J3M1_9AGAR|nr:hypothetical protein B0H16DRAFT_1886089 [Mycena metata]
MSTVCGGWRSGRSSCGSQSNWYYRHFSPIRFALDWQGGCGADVERFTSEHRDLVILDISHITLLECDVGVGGGLSGATERTASHATPARGARLRLRHFDAAELTERQFYRSCGYAVKKHFVTRARTDEEAVFFTLPQNRWREPTNNPNSVLADAHQAQEFPFTLQELAKNGMQTGIIIIDKAERADLLTLCPAVSFARLSPHELVVVYGGARIADDASAVARAGRAVRARHRERPVRQ